VEKNRAVALKLSGCIVGEHSAFVRRLHYLHFLLVNSVLPFINSRKPGQAVVFLSVQRSELSVKSVQAESVLEKKLRSLVFCFSTRRAAKSGRQVHDQRKLPFGIFNALGREINHRGIKS